MERKTSRLGIPLIVIALLIGLPLAALNFFTGLQTLSKYLIAAATFIPFGWVPCIIGAIGLLLVLRKWWKILAIVPLVVAFFAWGLPNVPRRANELPTPAMLGYELISANVQYGRADVAAIQTLIAPDTDLLLFQEYTSGFDQKLEAAGVTAQFPHRVGTIREDAGGTMILSRYPLTEVASTPNTAFDNILVRVTIRERDYLVANVHPAPPQLGAAGWAHDGAAVLAMVQPYLGERLIVVGDFNAIDQHHTMRAFEHAGFRNSMSTNTGSKRAFSWTPSWPVGGTLPPYARIDHALAGPGTLMWRANYVEVAGTDHRAMVVRGAFGA